MNLDQVQGRCNRIVGAVEQALGKLFGNRRMEITGMTKCVLGSAQVVHGAVRGRVQKRRLTPF